MRLLKPSVPEELSKLMKFYKGVDRGINPRFEWSKFKPSRVA